MACGPGEREGEDGMNRIIHALLRRHQWEQTGEYGIESIDAFRFAVERLRCRCGARRWDMTIESQLWGIRTYSL